MDNSYIENNTEIIESSSSSEYGSVISSHNIDIHNLPVNIENIQGEDNLIEYTTNHVTNKFYEDLRKIQATTNVFNTEDVYDLYFQSNSPMSLSNQGSKENSLHGSNNGSGSGSGSGSDSDNINPKSSFYNYYQIEKSIDKCYDNIDDNKYSSEIDILTTYTKGQKHLYTYSKNLLQWKLNLLMFPALFLTAAITIIAPFIECQHWSVGTISGLNAIVAFLISLINYLKYESSIESYLIMANQFDKLETSLDITNSKLLILDSVIDKRKLVFNKIKEFEKKINEIKEFNKTLIPDEIKTIFPIISHIQIFSFIKKNDNHKKNLLLKYKDVNNEIKYIIKKWKMGINNGDKEKENSRLTLLYEVRDKIKMEIYTHKNAYTHIDNLFSKEIYNADLNKSHWFKKNTIDLHQLINNYINADTGSVA